MLTDYPELTDSARKRWESKIRKTSTCWFWTGALKNGYGWFTLDDGSKVATHRYSYFLKNGQFDDDLVVCHICDNPSCINPDCLKLGTMLFNAQDRSEKGRSSRPFGELCGNSKLTQEQVDNLRKLRTDDVKVKDLVKIFNITDTQIYRICNGEAWNKNAIPGKNYYKKALPLSKIILTEKDITRFYRYIEKLEKPDGCWNWIGYTFRGYGLMSCQGAPRFVHRLAYIIKHGSIDDNLEISHTCGNPRCVNPGHLLLTTHKENMNNPITKERISIQSKKRRNNYKLTIDQVRLIKETSRDNPDVPTAILCEKLADKFNNIVLPESIRNILRGKSGKNIFVEGFITRYESGPTK
jgi:HNH endonuclease